MGFQAQTQVAIPGGGDSTAGMMHALSGLQKSVLLNRRRQDNIKQAAIDNALRAKQMEAETAYRNQMAADSAARLKMAQSAESRAAAEAERLLNERNAIKDAKVAAATGGYDVSDRTDGIVLDTPEKQTAYANETNKLLTEAGKNTGMVRDPYYDTVDNKDAAEWNALDAQIQEQLKIVGTEPELNAKYNAKFNDIEKRVKSNDLTRSQAEAERQKLVKEKEAERVALFGESTGGPINGIKRLVSSVGSPTSLIPTPNLGVVGTVLDASAKAVFGDSIAEKEEAARKARKATSEKAAERDALVKELRSKQDALTERIKSRTAPAWDDRNARLKTKTDSITKERKEGVSRYKTIDEINKSIAERTKQYVKDHPKATKDEIIAAHNEIALQAKPLIDNIAKVQASQSEIKTYATKAEIDAKKQMKIDVANEIAKATYNPKTNKPEPTSYTESNAVKWQAVVDDPDSSDSAKERGKRWLKAYDDYRSNI